jgi:hypothetical protein
MYVAILRNCQAHVISATLAHYIVTHGSRFRFSHQFAYIPISQYERYFQNESISTPIRLNRNKFEFGSSIINYIRRPLVLEEECNIHYFTHYKNVPLTKERKRNNDCYEYVDSHPFKATQCVVDRDDAGNYIPELPFCLLPDLAKVGNIIDFNPAQMSMAQYEIRERYAMFVCFLLFPFRTRDEVQTGKCNLTYIYIMIHAQNDYLNIDNWFLHIYRWFIYEVLSKPDHF